MPQRFRGDGGKWIGVAVRYRVRGHYHSYLRRSANVP